MRPSLKRERSTVEEPGKIHADDEDSTEFKLALLTSLRPGVDQDVLLDSLLASDGSVERALCLFEEPPTKKRASTPGYQSSLSSFRKNKETSSQKSLTKKGTTLHLFSPDDIAMHTPCSIIHNFLPSEQADALLRELLAEAPTYSSETFKLFDNVVTSPHTHCFYVDNLDEAERQKTDFVYNGSYIADIRASLPEMLKVRNMVKEAVNAEVTERIKTHYPDGKKLKYQSPDAWDPNSAFVNCYDGAKQSVGYHSDQLTYLGPRAIIGSLSLGVAREFRVRRILPRGPTDDEDGRKADAVRADGEGQIAIHLPHNSLLVMHAEMQEEWKHSVAPAQAIEPHPVAGNKRLNITYRSYRQSFHPKLTPKCRCDLPTILRCVQKRHGTRGRYMWMCYAGNAAGKESCGYFKWAEFNDDGEPPWTWKTADGNEEAVKGP